jgi:hypothetical protein
MGAGVRLLLSALFAPVLAYLAAMVVLGLLPANAGWVEAEEGVVVFVNTNGVHTGIGMPVANEVMDWRPLMPAAHLKRRSRRIMCSSATATALSTWRRRAGRTCRRAGAGRGVRGRGDFGPRRSCAGAGGGAGAARGHLVAGGISAAGGVRARALHAGRAGRTVPLPGRGYGEHDACSTRRRAATACG